MKACARKVEDDVIAHFGRVQNLESSTKDEAVRAVREKILASETSIKEKDDPIVEVSTRATTT